MALQLSDEQRQTYLRAMYRAFILSRMACWANDIKRAQAIAEAFHNLPLMLLPDAPDDWSPAGFWRIFVKPLLESYPDLRVDFENLKSL